MAWIEAHQTLLTHRKTLALADALGIKEVQVVGHMISLWTWALDNAPDANLPPSDSTIAKAARWEGDAETFINALIDARFLDCNKKRTLRIHNWDKYAGRLIRARKANTVRMRAARNKAKEEGKS